MRKIVSHPEILNGKPHLVGTHITVASILGKIAQRKSITEIARAFPQISEEDILIAIKYAEELLSLPANLEQ